MTFTVFAFIIYHNIAAEVRKLKVIKKRRTSWCGGTAQIKDFHPRETLDTRMFSDYLLTKFCVISRLKKEKHAKEI